MKTTPEIIGILSQTQKVIENILNESALSRDDRASLLDCTNAINSVAMDMAERKSNCIEGEVWPGTVVKVWETGSYNKEEGSKAWVNLMITREGKTQHEKFELNPQPQPHEL